MSKTICFNALMEYYCLQLVFGYPIPGYWHGLFYLKVYGKKYCDGSAVIYSQAALKGDSASHNRVALIYCCCTECESHEKYVHVCPYANAQAIVTLSYIIQMERCWIGFCQWIMTAFETSFVCIVNGAIWASRQFAWCVVLYDQVFARTCATAVRIV